MCRAVRDLQKTASCCSARQHKFRTTSSESALSSCQWVCLPPFARSKVSSVSSLSRLCRLPVTLTRCPLLAHLFFKRRHHLKGPQSSIYLLSFNPNQSEILKTSFNFLPIWRQNCLDVLQEASAQKQTFARNTFEMKSVAFAWQLQRLREVGAKIGCCKVKTGRGCWKRPTRYLCELHRHGNLTQRDSWRRAKTSTLILFGIYVYLLFWLWNSSADHDRAPKTTQAQTSWKPNHMSRAAAEGWSWWSKTIGQRSQILSQLRSFLAADKPCFYLKNYFMLNLI